MTIVKRPRQSERYKDGVKVLAERMVDWPDGAVSATVMYTADQYDRAIAVLQQAKTQLEPDGRACATCGAIDHQAFECDDNPLAMMHEAKRLQHSWRCWCCGEIFLTANAAEAHFGHDRDAPAMCLWLDTLTVAEAWDKLAKIRQDLHEHMSGAHDVTLLESELAEVIDIASTITRTELVAMHNTNIKAGAEVDRLRKILGELATMRATGLGDGVLIPRDKIRRMGDLLFEFLPKGKLTNREPEAIT